jgi:hypothetical protein
MDYQITRYLLTVALACTAASVTAQQREAMQACQADIQNYCAGVERGQGRLGKCLRENQDKLSEQCKTQLKNMAEKGKGKRSRHGNTQEGASTPAPETK